MDEEKEKLLMQRLQVENALNLARRRQKSLGSDNQARIDKLLDRWNQIQEKIERLKKK